MKVHVLNMIFMVYWRPGARIRVWVGSGRPTPLVCREATECGTGQGGGVMRG